jgi:DNA adenine methylase
MTELRGKSNRTPLTYYGGKQRIADALVALMPPHRLYLEPFAGGLAVLFRKPRAERETVNDLDGAIVAFWRALRERPLELAAAVAATGYARQEWQAAKAGLDEVARDVERARRLIVAIDQSYARCGDTWSPPSKLSDRPGRWQPGTWADMPERLLAAHARLQGVAIEHADALELIPRWDMPGALIYCDPPYTGEHRLRAAGRPAGGKRGYRYDDHAELWPGLAAVLLSIEHAAVMLSGYPCEATGRLELAGWDPVPLPARRHSGNRRGAAGQRAPETVWLSPACAPEQRPLAFALG